MLLAKPSSQFQKTYKQPSPHRPGTDKIVDSSRVCVEILLSQMIPKRRIVLNDKAAGEMVLTTYFTGKAMLLHMGNIVGVESKRFRDYLETYLPVRCGPDTEVVEGTSGED